MNTKAYIQRGVAEFLNEWLGINRKIKRLINYDEIPTHIVEKIYAYLQFEIKNRKIIPNDTFPFVYFGTSSKYKLFGVLGMVSIIGRDKVRKHIDFVDDAYAELESIPSLTGEFEKDLELYTNFADTLRRYESPTRNLNLVIYTRFMYKISEIKQLNED
jgi:hypothetical protein